MSIAKLSLKVNSSFYFLFCGSSLVLLCFFLQDFRYLFVGFSIANGNVLIKILFHKFFMISRFQIFRFIIFAPKYRMATDMNDFIVELRGVDEIYNCRLVNVIGDEQDVSPCHQSGSLALSAK